MPQAQQALQLSQPTCSPPALVSASSKRWCRAMSMRTTRSVRASLWSTASDTASTMTVRAATTETVPRSCWCRGEPDLQEDGSSRRYMLVQVGHLSACHTIHIEAWREL